MNRNKVFIGLGIMILVTIVASGIHFFYQSSPKEVTENASTTDEGGQAEEQQQVEQDTVEVNHNTTTLEKQLKEFVPLFYSATYAENSENEIDDYVTVAFLNEISKNEDNHEKYEDKDYSIRISGLSFYVPINTNIAEENTVKVLTSFSTSIRSSGSPEIDRPILVEITMEYSDTWRVSHVEDKSSLSQGGE
ncbi:hypothetical protein [Listeria seeligeri]|uniref:hypothetical protein n=1 Tax=Listeria seeligeri TaxID=1640 RepID=UPI00311B0375